MIPLNEKILVFKGAKLLGGAYKYLTGYIPGDREPVLVKEERLDHENRYLTVKHKGGICVLHRNNFWTMNIFKLIKKLESTNSPSDKQKLALQILLKGHK